MWHKLPACGVRRTNRATLAVHGIGANSDGPHCAALVWINMGHLFGNVINRASTHKSSTDLAGGPELRGHLVARNRQSKIKTRSGYQGAWACSGLPNMQHNTDGSSHVCGARTAAPNGDGRSTPVQWMHSEPFSYFLEGRPNNSPLGGSR